MWRLPDCCICYRPPEQTPDVKPLPALAAGYITFGVFNNLVKITDEVVAVWARVLHAVPNSRLLVLGRVDDRYNVSRFARHGIDRERLEFAGRRSRWDYLDLHNRVDIALDTFPFNGDNTTCDALWMGVPVVALKGKIFAQRRSFSHLSNMNLADVAADTTDEYVRIASQLANDLPRLSSLRTQMRERFTRSTLGDPARYTRNVEYAYLQMWSRWCASAP